MMGFIVFAIRTWDIYYVWQTFPISLNNRKQKHQSWIFYNIHVATNLVKLHHFIGLNFIYDCAE